MVGSFVQPRFLVGDAAAWAMGRPAARQDSRVAVSRAPLHTGNMVLKGVAPCWWIAYAAAYRCESAFLVICRLAAAATH
jgi:hypothetical protein